MKVRIFDMHLTESVPIRFGELGRRKASSNTK